MYEGKIEKQMIPKHLTSTCLIDNWSLECCGALLESGAGSIQWGIQRDYLDAISNSILVGQNTSFFDEIEERPKLDVYFGSLANLLTAIILFDRVFYVKNGFEATWQRFRHFSNRVLRVITGLDLTMPEAIRIENEYGQAAAPGFLYYSVLAKFFGTDLFLNPIRSKHLMKKGLTDLPSYGEYAEDLLCVLDKRLVREVDSLESDILKATLLSNLPIPPVANLVYSQATSREDILEVAMQIRKSHGARSLRKLLRECVGDIKHSLNYSRIVAFAANAIENAFRDVGFFDPERKYGSIGVNAFLISFSYDLPRPVAPHLIFLRDLAKCRLEILGSKVHLERLFGNNG